MSSSSPVNADDSSDWTSEDSVGREGSKAWKKVGVKPSEEAEEVGESPVLFSKLPRETYANTVKQSSPSLLSQLLNPPLAALSPHQSLLKSSSGSTSKVASGRSHRPVAKRIRRNNLPSTKYTSKVRVPLTAQVTPSTVEGLSSNPGESLNNPSSRMELGGLSLESDVESDSENCIALPRSLAERVLEALAKREHRRNFDRSGCRRPSPRVVQGKETTPSVLMPTPSAPLPLNFPYNLPAPPPLMTPRTTRRQMLSKEMSESFRRNLLWARRVITRTGPPPFKSSSGHQAPSEPLQVKPNDSQTQSNQEDRIRAIIAENRRALVAHNRKWTDDFHYSGW
ncbi:hypothetical protein BDY19DRAFT_998869 [Irpex rosettiformis]|uniref:Uncharacterized protein n=1 Tax=Irpex rosettiformis TaxID=378272 RepID=A0ACB8TM43_9APHY|nr:hypothetical protein BDY19DRAFT_998869 [Irpex rosettiformis]